MFGQIKKTKIGIMAFCGLIVLVLMGWPSSSNVSAIPFNPPPAPLGPGSFSCSCDCNTGSATGCSCSCDIDVPLPLPVYIYDPNRDGVEVAVKTNPGTTLSVYDEKVYKVLYGYLGPQGELPRGEDAKMALAQKVQGNIMNFITNKSDTLCPENEKFPDTKTCRRGVENWSTVMKDVEDNAKLVFYNDLASLNPDVIPDPLDKQILVDMLGLIVDRNPVGNMIEAYIKKAYNSEAFHITSDTKTGQIHTGNPQGDKQKLFSGIQQYFNSYVQEMKDTTKFMAELGGGWFGSWECLREIVDVRTGIPKCDPNNGYSYIITPGQMNTVANTILPTLDIEAAMNSTYFNAMYDKYARLRIDSTTGFITQGLVTDQALYQDDKNRLGFMMTGSLGIGKITPSCQVRVWPAEQIVLFNEDRNPSDTVNDNELKMTFDVYLSNADKEKTTIALDNKGPSIVSVENPPGAVENDIVTQNTYISTFRGISVGTTTTTVTASIARTNDDGTISSGACSRTIEVMVIPNITCTISLKEAVLNTLSLNDQTTVGAAIEWSLPPLGKPLERYPIIKKKVNLLPPSNPLDFDITPVGDTGAIDILKLLFSNFTAKFSDTNPIHGRSFTLTKPLIDFEGYRNLELNDLGTATVKTEVKLLGMGTPICEQEFEIKSGYRCDISACPPQRGGVGGNEPIVRINNGSTCTTAYCDYYSGVRTEDWETRNAYCIDACP